jgi:hypothetical protein
MNMHRNEMDWWAKYQLETLAVVSRQNSPTKFPTAKPFYICQITTHAKVLMIYQRQPVT